MKTSDAGTTGAIDVGCHDSIPLSCGTRDIIDFHRFVVWVLLAPSMLSFDLIILAKRQKLDAYPHIKQYAEKLAGLDSYQRAMQLEAKYDESI